jgi:uncharacterized protein (DUF362 family)
MLCSEENVVHHLHAIVRNFLTYGNKVVVAPSGNYGSVVDVVQKTGSQPVSEADNRNMVEFWKQIYGIDMGKAVKVPDGVRSYLYLTLIAENYGSVSKREKKRQLL